MFFIKLKKYSSFLRKHSNFAECHIKLNYFCMREFNHCCVLFLFNKSQRISFRTQMYLCKQGFDLKNAFALCRWPTKDEKRSKVRRKSIWKPWGLLHFEALWNFLHCATYHHDDSYCAHDVSFTRAKVIHAIRHRWDINYQKFIISQLHNRDNKW